MVREMMGVLRGAVIWEMMRLRYGIDEKSVVLILTGDNRELDRYALQHLQDYMERKFADKAVVVCQDEEAYGQVGRMVLPENVRLCKWNGKRVERLYGYYSFYRFSDRVVFTHTDSPKDNMLGRLLRETAVREEEAVCLGLYRLRKVLVSGKERSRHRGNSHV